MLKREVTIKWSDEDQVYVVRIFEGTSSILVTHGLTLSHALEMGKEALDLHNECLFQERE